MKQPTEAQEKKLWGWCGLDFYENDGRLWARTPSGGAIELLIDLNNLFKYAMSRLDQSYYYKALKSIFLKQDNPALALFWAIYSIIEEDKK